MKKIIKDIKNNEKGAISTLVLFTILMFIVILMGSFLSITTMQKAQLKSDIRIQEIYGQEVDKVDEIYLEQEAMMHGDWNKEKKVNSPKLVTGMTPIKFTMPTETEMGETEVTEETDNDWYEYGTTYETRRWANAQTKDGSMWVWIPRYAYKINKDARTIDVVFLIGDTDKYYDQNGEIKTAQRQTTADQTIDTTINYTVHPAFTDESLIDFANGGWDEELTGIWVAKFEAGYASGNNDAEVVASNVNYTQTTSWVKGTERGKDEEGNTLADGLEQARNWLDGIYGSTQTSIKYPVFMPLTYSMNYINHNDSYNIAKALTDSGNIYGFSKSNTDSHLMKNSEWGAVSYLSQSIYGQNGTEITINNIYLNSGSNPRIETAGKSGVDSVYAITGCTSNTTNEKQKTTTISTINSVTANISNTDGIYVWNQMSGQNASTTGTIYGIYDISGGTREKTTSYIANGNENLKKYGTSVAYENNKLKTISTKYTTVYPYDSVNTDTSQNNFNINTKIYGDAVRETASSNAGTLNSDWNTSSWNSDYSNFPKNTEVFFVRGGSYFDTTSAGAFAFGCTHSTSDFSMGLRAVVVPTM